MPSPRPDLSGEGWWAETPRATPKPEPPRADQRPDYAAPQPVRIEFSGPEREWMRFDGELRQDAALARGAKHLFGERDEPADRRRNVDTAASEAGVAKLLNVYWHPTPWQPGVADLAGCIEVRWTLGHNGARLPVRAKDDETRIYVLVSGNDSVGGMFARGWCYGWEAKRREWATDARDPRPAAWLVPVDQLRDLATLPDVHRFRLIGRFPPDETLAP